LNYGGGKQGILGGGWQLPLAEVLLFYRCLLAG